MIKFIFTALLLVYVPYLNAFAKNKECSISSKALKIASDIRTLAIKKQVPCRYLNKTQIKKYIKTLVKEELPANKLNYEDQLYKIIGLIPINYHYKKEIFNLYVNQIAGFYDPKKKLFVVADWIPESVIFPIAVHEQTHALQDQYFNLKTFIDAKSMPTDQSLARSAVIEGDATLVMFDYTQKLANKKSLLHINNINSFLQKNIMSLSLVDSTKAPMPLVYLMIFPYTSGLNFVHYIGKNKSYKSIDLIYKHPPNTTTEILHPDKYKTKNNILKTISNKELTYLLKDKKLKLAFKDRMGEFFISTLLGANTQQFYQGAQAGEGWRGDKLLAFVNNKDKIKEIIWKINWEDKNDIQQFINLYKIMLEKQNIECFSNNKKLQCSNKNKDIIFYTEKDSIASIVHFIVN